MLRVSVPEQFLWDEEKEEFLKIPGSNLLLEHSLIAVAEWEGKWHKPFLGDNDKTDEELKDYIRCMTINKDVDPLVYQYLPSYIMDDIFKYADDPMTATRINNIKKEGYARKKETITAEIIYYWMITLNVPIKFERWHLNRLITLIRVINIKNAPPTKMSKRDILARNAKINAQRRSQLKTRG